MRVYLFHSSFSSFEEISFDFEASFLSSVLLSSTRNERSREETDGQNKKPANKEGIGAVSLSLQDLALPSIEGLKTMLWNCFHDKDKEMFQM